MLDTNGTISIGVGAGGVGTTDAVDVERTKSQSHTQLRQFVRAVASGNARMARPVRTTATR